MFSWDKNKTSSNEESEQGPLLNVPSNYEESEQMPLKDIPLVISLGDNTYLLAAAILFAPPSSVAGLGHYSAAVRINKNFEVYDDLRPRPFEIDNTTPVCIHSILYVLVT